MCFSFCRTVTRYRRKWTKKVLGGMGYTDCFLPICHCWRQKSLSEIIQEESIWVCCWGEDSYRNGHLICVPSQSLHQFWEKALTAISFTNFHVVFPPTSWESSDEESMGMFVSSYIAVEPAGIWTCIAAIIWQTFQETVAQQSSCEKAKHQDDSGHLW